MSGVFDGDTQDDPDKYRAYNESSGKIYPVSSTNEILFWKRFADLRTTNKYFDLQEVALDMNTINYEDSSWVSFAPKTTQFLSARPLAPISSTDLFKERYDQIYYGVLISAGNQETTFTREVPTVLEAFAKIGGFYSFIFGASLVFGMVFIQPFQDNKLLENWN